MYKVILPFRYFVSRRITILAIAAIALCVFIVVVVMTVMNGLVEEFRNKNHAYAGDCVISTDSLVGFAYYDEFLGRLNDQTFVAAASAAVKSFGLLAQPGVDKNIGVEIMGIDPQSFARATGFGKTLYYHRIDPANAFMPSVAPDSAGCVLGIDMVQSERTRSGDYKHPPALPQIKLTISCFPLTVKGALAKAGTDLINTRVFYYSDDSHSGIVKTDSSTIYLPFDRVAALCGMDGKNSRASAIHVKFTDDVSVEKGSAKVAELWDRFKAARIAAAESSSEQIYASLLDNVVVQSWKSYRRDTIAPMEKEQTMMMLVFSMLGIITVFIILVVFYMIISSKSKDIGILKSIGISTSSVISVFIVFAGLIGFIGTAIGMAGGCAFLIKINDIEGWLKAQYNWSGVWDPSVYAIDKIPNNIEWQPLVIIGICAITACLIGALIPSYQAARRQVAQTLQVNQL